MKIKFLKFLWVLFIVPTVRGMVVNPDLKYGMTQDMIKEDIEFIESMEKKAVKESLGINEINSSEDVKASVEEVVQAINGIKLKNDADGINFLFWKGVAYLNGLIPTGYNRFWLNKSQLNKRKKSYRVMQLYKMLGYKDKRDEIEAADAIAYCLPLLNKSLYWKSINIFLNEAKVRTNTEIDSMLEERIEKSENQMVQYLEAAAKYIKSLHSLGIGTNYLKFNKNGLFKSFNEAENKTKDLMREYLEAFGKYMKELNENDGNRFLEELVIIDNLQRPISYLIEARNLWTKKKYNLYTHTERMTQYLRKQKNLLSEPFCAVSYYDPCTDSDPQIDHCEQIFAKTTPEELIQKRKHSDENETSTEKYYRPNAIIVSGRPYGSRNSDIRQARENTDLVNHSLWLFQLNLKSSQKKLDLRS